VVARIFIADVSTLLLMIKDCWEKQTNKHELNCNQRNKCNGSNQKIDTYIVTVADMVDIALASCPTWLCCLLLANSS